MLAMSMDVKIGESTYRISRLTADKGSWIRGVLISAIMKQQDESTTDNSGELDKIDPVERANGLVAAMWLLSAGTVDQETYRRVQMNCLQVCSIIPEGLDPLPILMKDGKWAFKELEYDAATVDEIVVKTLQFNLSPFFLGGASSRVLSSPPSSRLSNAPR
jgi:hypothetical protein